ncbi:MAG: DUF4861 family protein [Bacteroidales bacterium]|nr:DUF4861 family protein [Bacteroidales bacterium]
MFKTAIVSASSLLLLIGCGTEVKVTVTNGTDIPRVNETVTARVSPGWKNRDFIVEGSGGVRIPYQVMDSNGAGCDIIFQASVGSQTSATYTIRKGSPDKFDTLAYSRYVPERKDDYAYENNLIAGRIYGPALSDPRTFGPDVWLKCTERLIVNEWFAKGDYHHNYGDGMDCYKVANTLGGGACAPYCDTTIILGDNWAAQEHICDGPVRTSASFTYPEFEVDGAKVTAERTLSLDANTRLIHWTTVFNSDRDSIDVVLGAVLHDVLAISSNGNSIAFTEKASDSRNPERDGNISIGLILDPAYKAAFKVMDGHAVLAFRVKSGEAVNYWTASGWSQGGVESPEAWEEYVSTGAAALASPLKVTVEE